MRFFAKYDDDNNIISFGEGNDGEEISKLEYDRITDRYNRRQ